MCRSNVRIKIPSWPELLMILEILLVASFCRFACVSGHFLSSPNQINLVDSRTNASVDERKPEPDSYPWNTLREKFFGEAPSNLPFETGIRKRPLNESSWICGFNSEVKRPKVVYLIGLELDPRFSILEFIERYEKFSNCTYVVLSTTLSSDAGVRFIGDVMKSNGHNWIDFLHINIPGRDYSEVECILREYFRLPVTHINIKIHKNPQHNLTSDAIHFENLNKWWRKFEKVGVEAFSWEITGGEDCMIAKKRDEHRGILYERVVAL